MPARGKHGSERHGQIQQAGTAANAPSERESGEKKRHHFSGVQAYIILRYFEIILKPMLQYEQF
jgi:hypothetical protein